MGLERILVVDDELIIRKSIEERLRAKRYSVSSAACIADAEKLLARDNFDLVLLDVHLPDGDGRALLERLSQGEKRPMVVMITGNASIEVAVECMRAGAFDFVIKPFSIAQIEVVLNKAAEYDHVVKVRDYLNREQAQSRTMIGESPAIVALHKLIQRVGRTDATVLINGENGTGKELVANEIFLNSPRSKAPFIKVNCAAISETLMESEFFGHERGAFTGATERRDGRFELADGGTILLDEISEIPMNLQAKLLRVLQEREFERVGGNKTIKVNVRVLATTNRNLMQAVKDGDFREDLYYRLNVFPLQVPPLRDRKGDILLLANRFLERFAKQHGLKVPGFAKEATEALLAHSWPGNVRELQNSIERAAILAEEGVPISAAVLGLSPLLHPSRDSEQSVGPAAARPPGNAAEEILPLEEMEKRWIFAALERTGGNRTQAADLLQISIRTLRNKLNQYKGGGASTPEDGLE